MPMDAIIAVGAVTAALTIFGVVLAYADWASSHPFPRARRARHPAARAQHPRPGSHHPSAA